MQVNKPFVINIPISKVDEEQRVVTGIATSEALDSQGDIVDYEASKKAFADWVGIGNIREMHEPIAVGKAIDVQFDDANKQVIVSAKISESADGQNTWTKVREGVLTGFSIGGRVFEVAKDKAVEGANRVLDYALSELSLVDNPACPEAKLLMVKSVDGKAKEIKEPKMQKSVWDAQEALSAASQIAYLIMIESAEGEADQVADLVEAFNRLRDFAAKEVSEGDDYVLEYNEVMELATKAINLRKGKLMADKKVEKTNVVGGEERDINADVVTTREEAGRPVNDTEERAAEAGVAPAGTEEEITVKTEGEEAPVEDEDAEVAEETETEEVVEEAADDEETEEKPAKKDEKKADTPELVKSVETLLTKLNDKSEAELKKVADAIKTEVGKVAKSVTALEDRIATLEKQELPTKGQRFAVVAKGEDEDEVDEGVKAVLKRQEEIMANPGSAKPGEVMDIALKLRKANIGKAIEIK